MSQDRTECPECHASRGLAEYEDHVHCFSCGHHAAKNGGKSIESFKPSTSGGRESLSFSPLTNVFRDFASRSIPRDAVRKFQIDVNANAESDVEAKYPLFNTKGEHVANKVRKKGKQFYIEGDPSDLQLFGQQAFPAGSAKAITIVEGQDDAAAAFAMEPYPVVSVHSASSAVADLKRNYEYVNSFEKIVIAFDNDEVKINPKTGEKSRPGKDAALRSAQLFKPGKVHILDLQKYKDANDYLKNKAAALYVREWYRAQPYKPDGIKMGSEMWDEIINRPTHFSVNWPFPKLQESTYGIRLSEFVLIHAPTGIGKTSIIKEMEYELLTNKDIIDKGYGVGFLHLEEPNHDTALGLMSIHNSKPYHLPDTDRTTDELRAAYDAVINSDRVVIWDHFGSNSVDAVLDKVRHMHALGCKYIVVDHLSIIVSDQSGDERKQLDEISTKLKTICMELNVAMICVIHQNRQGQVRGTAGVEQVANVVIRLERDKTALNPWRRNVLKTVVEKNRFSGTTGPASYLLYDNKTGRLNELDEMEVSDYEAGIEPNDTAIPF